jgi:ABC-type nitrate/sulfonate/bicarbonate transport system substrate-binding protein
MRAPSSKSPCALRRRLVAPALLLVLVLSFAALANGAAAKRAGATADPVLNIGIGAPTPQYGSLWLAFAYDLFAKHHVKVNVLTYNATATQAQQFAAGQMDMSMTGSSALARIKLSGLPIKVVYSFTKWDYHAAALIAQPAIKSIGDLQAKGGSCRIATQFPGGGLYGLARSAQIVYGLKCQLVNFNTDDAINAALLSGAVDAATVNSLQASVLSSAGKGNLIIDPFTLTKTEGLKLYPKPFSFWVAGGPEPLLKAKRVAVQRFIAALRDASALAEFQNPATLAKVARRWSPAFGATDVGSLEKSFEGIKPNMGVGKTPGRITPADWDSVLDQLAFWEVPGLKATDPALSYRQMVDNTYYDKTTAIPLSKSKQHPREARPCRPTAQAKS